MSAYRHKKGLLCVVEHTLSSGTTSTKPTTLLARSCYETKPGHLGSSSSYAPSRPMRMSTPTSLTPLLALQQPFLEHWP